MFENESKRGTPRDSDNPILEEYKEDLLNKPMFVARDEERIIRLEGLANELLCRIESLEQRTETLEKGR